MKCIKILNTSVGLDLIYYEQFKSAFKYETSKESEYTIKSIVNQKLDVSTFKLEYKTEFYDIYKENDKTIQVQKYGDRILGAIVYDDKIIYLYMYEEASFDLEYLLSQYALVYILDKLGNNIFMHGSSLVCKGKGIVFTAKSGTGKSTHSRLWQKYSDAVVINDDKNIISIENGELFLNPCPWSGKHMLDNNIKAPLKAIVFLYQSRNNIVKRLSPFQTMKLILPQLESPSALNLDRWNLMLDELLKVDAYYLGCNMEKEAFDVIYKKLEEEICL